MADTGTKDIASLISDGLSGEEARVYKEYLDIQKNRDDAFKAANRSARNGYISVGLVVGTWAAAYYIGREGAESFQHAIATGLENKALDWMNFISMGSGILSGFSTMALQAISKSYGQRISEMEQVPNLASAKAKMEGK